MISLSHSHARGLARPVAKDPTTRGVARVGHKVAPLRHKRESPSASPRRGLASGNPVRRGLRLVLAPEVGLEPTTLRLTAGCSAIELLRNSCDRVGHRSDVSLAQPTQPLESHRLIGGQQPNMNHKFYPSRHPEGKQFPSAPATGIRGSKRWHSTRGQGHNCSLFSEVPYFLHPQNTGGSSHGQSEPDST